MEHLSNELIQMVACEAGRRETCVYCTRNRRNSCSSMCLSFQLNPSAPVHACPMPKQAPPLHPKRDVQRKQSERKDYRLFYETLAYVAKTVCQETQCDTITNLTAEPVRLYCSHRDLNRSSVSVATNYYVLCQHYCFFINTFINVSINNIVLQMQLLAWGVDFTCRVHGRWL